MIKFSIKLAGFLAIFLSSVAQAGLITKDSYVTIGELDWAWASKVSAQYHNGDKDNNDNELFAPTIHDGWDYATEEQLITFISERNINDFISKDEYGNAVKDANGETVYIIAFSFWNSIYHELDLFDPFGSIITDVDHFINGSIQSKDPNIVDSSDWSDQMFYVRNTPSQVPEPSTIMIFAIALITLSMRKRAIK
jgi:hypothetical protein